MGLKIDVLGVSNAQQYMADIHTVGELLIIRTLSSYFYNDFVWWLSGKQSQLDKLTKRLSGYTRKIIEARRSKWQMDGVNTIGVQNDNVLVFMFAFIVQQ